MAKAVLGLIRTAKSLCPAINQYPGTNVTINPTNIIVTGNLGYYGNGTNLQGVVTTNGAQPNYEPVFTPGSGVNGITWQPATNVDIVTTVTFSNIPPLTLLH